MTHILNDVLSLQKIEDGALTLDCAPFDMGRMVRSTLHSFRAPCRERNLRLLVNLDDLTALIGRRAQLERPGWCWPPGLPPPKFGLLGDANRLRQVGDGDGKRSEAAGPLRLGGDWQRLERDLPRPGSVRGFLLIVALSLPLLLSLSAAPSGAVQLREIPAQPPAHASSALRPSDRAALPSALLTVLLLCVRALHRFFSFLCAAALPPRCQTRSSSASVGASCACCSSSATCSSTRSCCSWAWKQPPPLSRAQRRPRPQPVTKPGTETATETAAATAAAPGPGLSQPPPRPPPPP